MSEVVGLTCAEEVVPGEVPGEVGLQGVGVHPVLQLGEERHRQPVRAVPGGGRRQLSNI